MSTPVVSARPNSSFDAAVLALVRATDAKRGRSLAVMERTGRRGEMTPLHVHPEDEVVYVVEGALTQFVAVESREARYLSATVARSAARYEDFLRAVAVPAEGSSLSWQESGDASRLAAIAAPNGIDVLGEPGVVV